MQKTLCALTLGIAGVLIAYTPAQSQTRNCAERSKVIEKLNNTYGETRQSIGLAQNNGVVEVFASPESGTWTIVVTMPNGMTCLVAAGNAFEDVEEASVKQGEKA